MNAWPSFNVFQALFLPPVVGFFWHSLLRRFGRWWPALSSWMWAAVGGTAGYAAGSQWPAVVAGCVSFTIALTIWWWRRRKDRKRALRALGAKSRARIADLVATLRERSKPRPVLRPQPGRVLCD